MVGNLGLQCSTGRRQAEPTAGKLHETVIFAAGGGGVSRRVFGIVDYQAVGGFWGVMIGHYWTLSDIAAGWRSFNASMGGVYREGAGVTG
jgi:hypothetical protein